MGCSRKTRSRRSCRTSLATVVALGICVAGPAGADVEPPDPLGEASAPDEGERVEVLSPELRLRRGRGAFDAGDCSGTAAVLAPLAVPGSLADPKDQIAVHWMLGVCFALLERPTEAAREFSSLLVLNPDYAIDGLLTPPAAVEVFERQRTQMNAQLDEIRRAREEARRARRDVERGVLVERRLTVREVPLPAVFLPFGFSQAANGQTGWAVLFGVTQGALLATNVTAYWVNIGFKARTAGTDESLPTGDELLGHRIAWFTHAGALGGFVLAYAAGVAQAWWAREDNVVVDREQTRRALTPDEVKKLRDIKQAPAPVP